MKIIGHRGARGLAPENTLASISHALYHHADEIEIDVRITRDHVAVLHHNPTVRIGGERLRISQHTYAELRRHKPDLATLDAALDLIGTKARPHIEIKPGEAIEPVVKALKQHLANGHAASAVLVGSKSQQTLVAFHRTMPAIELVVIESWSGVRARLRARQLGTKRLNMRSWWLWTGFLMAMHRAGYQIAPYTINNSAKARKWQQYLYGVITDRPDLFDK